MDSGRHKLSEEKNGLCCLKGHIVDKRWDVTPVTGMLKVASHVWNCHNQLVYLKALRVIGFSNGQIFMMTDLLRRFFSLNCELYI